MVVTIDVDKLTEDLEKQELEAPNGVAPPHVYAQLLSVYLYQNDLCNAKYLWKRIPANVKSSSAELQSIWTVGQFMWKRELASTYEVLNTVAWTDGTAEIMKSLTDKVRSRAIDLISQAYSSVALNKLAAMIGMSMEAAADVCRQKGWNVEADTGVVHPKQTVPHPSKETSSKDQLYKLTDFVSFLEN